MPPTRIDDRDAALLCAEIAYDKKADDILILDVSKILVITSYFVIASGDSRKQLQAIGEAIHEKLKPLGFKRYGAEGVDEGKWILLDYGDVIVQLFDREKRSFYNLEMIWGDAPRVPFTPKAAGAAGAGAGAGACESIGSRAHREGIAAEGKEEEVLQLEKVAGPPTTQPSVARPSEAPREIDLQALSAPPPADPGATRPPREASA